MFSESEHQSVSTTGGAIASPRARSGLAPLSICHLISTNFLGGPEKQILAHCVQLQRAGWHSLVASFRENRSHVEIIEAAAARGLSTFLLDTRSPFDPRAVRQLQSCLDQAGTDVLVTHGYKSNVVGWLTCRRRDTAHVPFVRGFTAENWRVRRYEEIDRWVLRRARALLCVSEGTRLMLTQRGVAAHRLTVVHNAVDCDLADATPHLDLRTEFGWPPETRVIVAAGRLSPEKGHRILIEAMGLLAADRPPLHLVLLGDGPESERLQRQTAQLSLDARIVFAGFRRDALSCMAGADLVVNPSFSEGLPNVLLEAFSLGKPVVATDVGGTRELVQNGRTGWLVPSGDAAAVASAIRAAFADAEGRAALAGNARRLVEWEFSFSQQAERLMQFYRTLHTEGMARRPSTASGHGGRS